MVSLTELIVNYHKTPSKSKKKLLRKALDRAKEQNDDLPEKIGQDQADRRLLHEMKRRDDELHLQWIKARKIPSLEAKLDLVVARRAAQSYSNAHFVASKYYPIFDSDYGTDTDSDSDTDTDAAAPGEDTVMAEKDADITDIGTDADADADAPGEDADVPAAEPTESRLGSEPEQIEPPQQSLSTIKPYLYVPSPSEAKDLVAYRGNLLAVFIGPGCYKLMSISEQFLWNKQSLSESGKIDAGKLSTRILNGYGTATEARKSAILSSIKGIVGIAHRGYHTLNMASAEQHGRHIGQCFVEVAWGREIKQLLPDDTILPADGIYRTFEIRTDWRRFRGAKRGDYEIYWFAKHVGTGEIPPGGGVRKIKRRPKAIEGTVVSHALTPPRCRWVPQPSVSDMVYSDSEEEEEEEEEEDGDVQD